MSVLNLFIQHCLVHQLPPPPTPQHHHRNRLQSRLHTKPDMPHLLFNHHTRCSPTPSSMMMSFFAPPPPPSTVPHHHHHHPPPPPPSLSHCAYLWVWLHREWAAHMHACSCRAQQAALPANPETQRSHSGPRGCGAAGVLCKLHSAAWILPWAGSCLERGRRSSAKHLCTHTHSPTKPICIQVQPHTSTHSGTLTDTHNTPPKKIAPTSDCWTKSLMHNGLTFTFSTRARQQKVWWGLVQTQIHLSYLIERERRLCNYSKEMVKLKNHLWLCVMSPAQLQKNPELYEKGESEVNGPLVQRSLLRNSPGPNYFSSPLKPFLYGLESAAQCFLSAPLFIIRTWNWVAAGFVLPRFHLLSF